jgi:hypothetical protein
MNEAFGLAVVEEEISSGSAGELGVRHREIAERRMTCRRSERVST